MARLVDRLLEQDLFLPSFAYDEKNPQLLGQMLRSLRDTQQGLRETLKETVIIVADNVAEYLYAGTDQEVWNLERDFPSLAPPFPRFFIEWRRPSKIVSCERGVTLAEGLPRAVGILFEASTAEDITAAMKDRENHQRAKDYIAKMGQQLERVLLPKLQRLVTETGSNEAAIAGLTENERTMLQQYVGALKALEKGLGNLPSLPENIAWTMVAYSFVEVAKDAIIGPLGHWQFCLDHAGVIVPPHNFGLQFWTKPEWPPTELTEPISTAIFTAALTLSFLHCKNVVLKTEAPPEKLNRAYQKRHGKPLSRFHTLEIEPMKQVLRTEGKSEETGLKRAIHICRGHFADYSDGKGLFGKYHGRYWIPAHVKGTKSEGIVMKRYNVKAPRQRRAA